MKPTSVFIIEPIALLALGIKYTLERHPGLFSVAGTVRDVESFKKSSANKADVILINTSATGFSKSMDIRKLLPDNDGSLIVATTCEALLGSAHSSFDGVLNLYKDETQTVEELIHIIKGCGLDAENSAAKRLSLHEKRILVLLFHGFSNKAIAEWSNTSVSSIKSTRKRLLEKTQITSAAQLSDFVTDNGLDKLIVEDLIQTLAFDWKLPFASRRGGGL
jgi:DNA-binding NarL/FixJ family response regulator